MSARKPGDSNRPAQSFPAMIDAAAFAFVRQLEISDAKLARADVPDLSQVRALLQTMGLMKVGDSNVKAQEAAGFYTVVVQGVPCIGAGRQVKGGAV